MNIAPVESTNFWKGSATVLAGITGMGIGEFARQMIQYDHVPYLRVFLLVVFAVACGWVLGHHYATTQAKTSEGESLD